ncbi:isocitrate/isopropylmalate dehydrogenase family protein [Aureimonas fodinaquatilis]|uniref:Isocitrate/isopropylmalate dehydrogenase family protein n=1 Tax=Aureimonas fodinaquatilis TaxID=2565783 RepID=A0A5B0DTS5_9HYPH|nr:isocitrate/isopropylmalate dehydrogenase family protein [Aureimonas fodinaquatilis]KAA0969335.1 isocitrate/isopropylmalate dehydrogenase family protein [Aureimonas fodinaquatilis]
MKLVLLPGDGIGPEIAAATRGVLEAAIAKFDLTIDIDEEIVGHASLARHGATVTEALLDKVRVADGLILGPAATFEFKDESKGEINPSMFFRKRLDLFANIRPARSYEGVPNKVGPFDMVVVRENTEGFYTDRNMEAGNGEILVTPDVAIALRRITRLCCERIARSAFELARTRNRHVTFVHKANVLKVTDGLFLSICRDVASEYPDVETDDVLVDAMMAHVVRTPARFDVVVTTNMYGDILSDLTAELSGSLGMGGSLNTGTHHAMAQASHGSAPDIAGRDIANPISLILSTAQLLHWFGMRNRINNLCHAAGAIEGAVEAALRTRQATHDVGGNLGTKAAGQAIAALI